MEQDDIRLSRRVLIKHKKEIEVLKQFMDEIKNKIRNKLI
ncbi:MAG: hypothetical protein BAJALOKI3v1_30069 [Promethearchaeota archaeon]|jgi:hypothetical protein|nr:MAG: hypothetical protein BAJALOKI3v1_30069 [Candidatus Lokiarchaeota archaeon]